MCTIIQKYAITGLVNIATANGNLNGSGTFGTVLTAPSDNGTRITSITVKATGNTTEGMVRLFVYDGTNHTLWKEIIVSEKTQSATVEAFQTTISDELTLDPGQTLLASTQNAESFNVFADGIHWGNCTCSNVGTCSDRQIVAHTGAVTISTANANLDGSGSIGTVLTAPTGSLVLGSQIISVDVKAIVSTDQGMVRLFINNGTTKYLIWEIPIPGTTQSNVQPTFRTSCFAAIGLQPGYSICASTQNSNAFNIITFAADVTNCPCPNN